MYPLQFFPRTYFPASFFGGGGMLGPGADFKIGGISVGFVRDHALGTRWDAALKNRAEASE